uniref:hypothetical protein n=1 Tax=Nocardia jiangxiensis TaxID=282685 RepID=UPI000592F28B
MRRADEAATAQGRENNARGEHYHRGMAEIRRENRENGWVREYVEPSTNQRLDQARVYVNEELRAFREYKSGRIDGRSLEQLRKHKELLEKEVYRSGEWVSATPLAQAPGEFRDLVKQMREQLNFRFVVTPRELTERAMQLGRQLTPGVQQLELVSGYELHRRDRARKRLNNIRAIVQAREAKERTERETQERETQERERKQRERKELDARKRDIARVVGANSKAIAVAKADGASFPTRELRDAHSDVSRALEDVREKEQEQTREMLADLEFGGKSAHVMEEILAQGRERQRARLTTQIDALGKEATAREE